jgi:hypothetical protein
LHRRATDSAPFSSLVTGRAARSLFAPRTDGLSGIARVAGFAFLRFEQELFALIVSKGRA